RASSGMGKATPGYSVGPVPVTGVGAVTDGEGAAAEVAGALHPVTASATPIVTARSLVAGRDEARGAGVIGLLWGRSSADLPRVSTPSVRRFDATTLSDFGSRRSCGATGRHGQRSTARGA